MTAKRMRWQCRLEAQAHATPTATLQRHRVIPGLTRDPAAAPVQQPHWIAGQARNDTGRPTRRGAADRASINRAAGSRQAVPGRADFWGGWAARAWAQRA